MRRLISLVTITFLLATSGVFAQGVREHTRLKSDRSTAVSESQATELTLTVNDVEVRPIQHWVRTAGVVDRTGQKVTAAVSPTDGAMVKVGQRVRAFPPEARSSMYQARITQVVSQADRVLVTATLSGPGQPGSTRYVLEIVTERGDFLSVPNEAIIETEGKRLVYVQQSQGRYVPREIRTGIQGERYTEVLEGLNPTEKVVTFGSFFVDADQKLKGS